MWAMLEYLPIYGSFKNLASVISSVLCSHGFLSNFKFKHCFETLLMSLVGNLLLFKIFAKFSKPLFFPVVTDFVAPIQQSFNETNVIFRRCQTKTVC